MFLWLLTPRATPRPWYGHPIMSCYVASGTGPDRQPHDSFFSPFVWPSVTPLFSGWPSRFRPWAMHRQRATGYRRRTARAAQPRACDITTLSDVRPLPRSHSPPVPPSEPHSLQRLFSPFRLPSVIRRRRRRPPGALPAAMHAQPPPSPVRVDETP